MYPCELFIGFANINMEANMAIEFRTYETRVGTFAIPVLVNTKLLAGKTELKFSIRDKRFGALQGASSSDAKRARTG